MILQNGIFQSDLLDTHVHGFTTREWGNLGYGKNPGDPEVTANRKRLFDSLLPGDWKHIQPRQVHSDKAIDAKEFIAGTEADAAYSSMPGHLLSVLTADCIPILISHPEGVVCVIHAGWRGLNNGIITKTMSKIPEGSIAVIGPAIGSCCYEVDESLASEFEKTFGAGVVVRGKKKPHLDLVEIATLQLLESGVQQMEASRFCTSCYPELFFSYRRDGSSGRMMAFIGIAPRD